MSHCQSESASLAAESIAHWNALAAEQERLAAGGLVLPAIAASRAELYRRTARAIEIEQETGIPVCACCHKPLGKGMRV